MFQQTLKFYFIILYLPLGNSLPRSFEIAKNKLPMGSSPVSRIYVAILVLIQLVPAALAVWGLVGKVCLF